MALIHLYPKLVIEVESSKTPEALAAALDSWFALAKDDVRSIFGPDPDVRIVAWHSHTSAGPTTDIEPG